MRVIWRRGVNNPHFNRPAVYFTLGQINSGKSTLLEHIGIEHAKKDAAILDVFGSVDGEGLAWLRSDLVKEKEVCLLRGDNVDITTEHDTKTIDQLTLNDLEKYDFILSARPLYVNRDHEYYTLGKLINLLYNRFSWNRLVCMIAREASSLWYSRVKVSDTQTDMKSESLYMFKEMRHLGVSLALDSLRLQAIDVELRTHIDYLFIKGQGIEGLPENLRFLYYNFFDPFFLQNMKPYQFALVCRTGELGTGHFVYHDWHKVEKENIVKKVGLKIEYGAELKLGKGKGSSKSVGDKEHMDMIKEYSGGLSYEKIAAQFERSIRTPYTQIKKHNESVERSGFCAVCKRGKGEFTNNLITRV